MQINSDTICGKGGGNSCEWRKWDQFLMDGPSPGDGRLLRRHGVLLYL